MAKDPAVLWYYSDYMNGTIYMTNAEIGAFTRLLMVQADKGSVSRKMIDQFASEEWEFIKDKFVEQPDGTFINPRMETELDKRRKYSKSRSENRKEKRLDKETYEKHMKEYENHIKTYETHMEDEDENIYITNLYIKTMYKLPNLWEQDQLKILALKHPKEKLEEAFRQSGLAGARNLRYVMKVLENGDNKNAPVVDENYAALNRTKKLLGENGS